MVSSLDIDAVRVFLEALGLSERYHAAFMEDGFDSLARVAAMDDDDLSAIPGMRRGHKKQIKAAKLVYAKMRDLSASPDLTEEDFLAKVKASVSELGPFQPFCLCQFVSACPILPVRFCQGWR